MLEERISDLKKEKVIERVQPEFLTSKAVPNTFLEELGVRVKEVRKQDQKRLESAIVSIQSRIDVLKSSFNEDIDESKDIE